MPASAALSGDRITATATVATGSGRMTHVTLEAAAADASVILYDALSATGTILMKVMIDVSIEGNVRTKHVPLPTPVGFSTGIHAVIAGTGAAVIVHYQQQRS